MKLYKINEYDWWAGPDLKTTVQAYVQDTGLTEEEMGLEDPTREVTEAEMETLIFTDEYGMERTFREQFDRNLKEGLGKGDTPFYFATTEIGA